MEQAANTASLYEQYVTELQRIADIRYSVAVLQWDQETYMPPAGAGFRAQQIATLSELAHSRFTNPGFVNLVTELSGRSDLHEEGQKNISLSRYDVEQQVKLPSA